MKCDKCGHEDTRVIDTRRYDTTVVRVRECVQCGNLFRTYELREGQTKVQVDIQTYEFTA